MGKRIYLVLYNEIDSPSMPISAHLDRSEAIESIKRVYEGGDVELWVWDGRSWEVTSRVDLDEIKNN